MVGWVLPLAAERIEEQSFPLPCRVLEGVQESPFRHRRDLLESVVCQAPVSVARLWWFVGWIGDIGRRFVSCSSRVRIAKWRAHEIQSYGPYLVVLNFHILKYQLHLFPLCPGCFPGGIKATQQD